MSPISRCGFATCVAITFALAPVQGETGVSANKASTSGTSADATFFQVAHNGGKWQILAPEGQPFFLRGVNHYGDGSHMPWNRERYENRVAWRQSVRDRVKEWGFNYLPPSIGPSAIDPRTIEGERSRANLITRTKEWPAADYSELDFPFTIFLEYPRQYMAGSNLPDVFSPKFAEAVDARCREVCEPLKTNRNLVGYHFCHNPPWHPQVESFNLWIKSSVKPGSHGRKEWIRLMRRIYGSIDRWRETYGVPIKSWEEIESLEDPLRGYISRRKLLADKEAFMKLICEKWYRTYHDAIRKYDTNHLIFGDRNTLHLQPLPPYAISIMSKYIDVLSVNVMGPRRTVYGVLEDATRHWTGPIHLADTGACVYSPGMTRSGYQARDLLEFETVYSDLMKIGVEHPQVIGFGWCGFYETPPPGARGGLVDVQTGNAIPARLEIVRKWNRWMDQQVASKPLHTSTTSPVAQEQQVNEASRPSNDSSKPRLAILTDIGGDPDDQQSLIRLMVYLNEFEIEALIASASGTPGELKDAVTRPDLIREIVNAYGEVRSNLQKHATGWPDHNEILKRIKTGNPLRGRKHIGIGHDTEGSRELIHLIDQGTKTRPLNVSIWGGQTDLAQALFRVKHDRGREGLSRFVKKLRVYDIADQDGIADWIQSEFPGLYYILSKSPAGADKREASFRGMYLTGDESLTSRQWIETHVRSKGPLGALYPTKTWTTPNEHGCMKEGDTPSWFFFLPHGGNDPDDPTKPGGWGGRFIKSNDGWYRDIPVDGLPTPRDTVSRHRPTFQADFAKRMSWCFDEQSEKDE